MRYKTMSRRGLRRRSVAWEAVSFGENLGVLDRVTVTLLTQAGRNGGSSFFQLTNSGSLQSHGGEDTVVTRVVGDIHVVGGAKNATPTSAFINFAIVQAMSDAQNSTVPLQQMFNTNDAARDNILWQRTLWCPALPVAAPTALQPWVVSTQVDVRAQRKLQEENQLYLLVSSAGPGNDTIVNQVTFSGCLRLLLKRPR